MNEAVFVSVFIGAGIAVLFARLSAVERRLSRLSRLDAKVDALLRNSGIQFDEFQDVPADVREALQRGETILAIKRFRQATGAGLKEAKEFIDEIRRRQLAASR
jgi:ribosomal protein L7/L12